MNIDTEIVANTQNVIMNCSLVALKYTDKNAIHAIRMQQVVVDA